MKVCFYIYVEKTDSANDNAVLYYNNNAFLWQPTVICCSDPVSTELGGEQGEHNSLFSDCSSSLQNQLSFE